MQYLILALIIVLGITISTLITQSWWWGFVVWIIIWIVFIGTRAWHVLTMKQRKKELKKVRLIFWVRLLTWVVTWARLWVQDLHCRQTPDTTQWAATVDRVWKSDESYLIRQWNYQRIYETSESLQPWQQVMLYAVTQKLQTCITTYTHRDIWYRKLQNRIRGEDFDYDRWLVMKWVDGYIQWKIVTIRKKEQWISLKIEENKSANIATFKDTIIDQITTIFPNQRSAWRAGWTLIWTKDLIHKDDYDLLINSWLVHLIVVSGGNLALVILILWAILFRVPMVIRYILIGWWLIVYVMIVWPDSSVLRALAMAIMTILWILAGRRRSFGWMLSITTIMLLRYNPMMIYDVWLRLSLSAVIGIYITYHEVSRLTQQRPKKWRKQLIRQILLIISASIGAWLGTLPILIWQFGSANLTSIIANSITGIIASITTIAELITIALSPMINSESPWVGLLSSITQWWVRIVNQLVSLIYRIAKLTVERWVWIWAGSQSGFWIITWSITIIFILLYRHTQKMRVEYLLEIKDL